MVQLQLTVHVRVDECDEFVVQHRAGALRIGDTVDGELGAQLLHELGARPDAEVGGDEGGLEVVPGVLVDVVGAEQLGKTASQGIVAVSQTTTQPCQT